MYTCPQGISQDHCEDQRESEETDKLDQCNTVQIWPLKSQAALVRGRALIFKLKENLGNRYKQVWLFIYPLSPSSPETSQLWPFGNSYLLALFCMTHELRMLFTFLSEWFQKKKRKERRILLHDRWKLHEIQLSVSPKLSFMEHSNIYLFTCSLWLLFCLQKQNWVIVAQTVWPTKIKIFTICPWSKGFTHPCWSRPIHVFHILSWPHEKFFQLVFVNCS